jgi:pilus assembly protein CpaB
MKLLKNRFVVGALCIIAALLIAFFALPALQGSQGAYISAVRIKQPIEAGTQLTAEMLETVNVPESLVKGGISDISLAVGKYAFTDLYAGDYLTAEKFSTTLAEQNSFPAGTAKGKLVISVTLPSLASGVSGQLLPGDIVTVMSVSKSDTNQKLGVEPTTDTTDENIYNTAASTVIYPELQYVEVCRTTTNDGADASVEADPGKDEKNSLPVTVSFYVSQEQALRLAELEQQGTIYLAFVARSNDAAQYISDADRVLNSEVD